MKRYNFKAKDTNGKLIKGEVEAQDENAAAKLIRKRGLIVIAITPTGGLLQGKLFGDRITGGDLATFTRQMATMINSGLPITETLIILRQGAKASLSHIVSQLHADIEQGESLSSSMSKHPTVFSKAYIALIKAGETGGVLDTVLVRLADDMEKQEEFKGKVKGALVYPVIIVIGMILVAIVMLVFVVPRLTSLYSQFDAELPLPTKILMALSSSLSTLWPIYLVLLIGAAYGFNVYRSTPDGRRKIDELMFKIPILGPLRKTVMLTELTRTLSLMTASGVSILEGLSITAAAVDNTIISGALEDVAKSVEKGFPLAYSFGKHPDAFPFILSQMIAVGEETGKIDEVLAKISHIFEIESEQQVKALTVALEPTILIILGIGVAFLIISVIMPIYNLTTKL